MMIASPVFDAYRQRFAEDIARRREPSGIAELRRKAFEQFQKWGLPTRHQEAWRLTDLSSWQEIAWQPPTTDAVQIGAVPLLEGISTHQLVFVNGRFAPALSCVQELPEKTLVIPFQQAVQTHPEVLESYLDRLPGLTHHPFVALNTAFWEDGALIALPQGMVLKTPIHLVFHTEGEQTAVHPRLLVHLAAEAQATIVVEYQGQGGYCNSPVAEIVLGNSAVLEYAQIQDEAPEAHHFGGLRIQQAGASRAFLQLLSWGSRVVRTDLEVLLDGVGAGCVFNGLALAKSQQDSACYVRVEHARPQCLSEQHYRSVLDGAACTVFDGTIHVRQYAQKTEAHQLNRNLLLSRHARAHAHPRLEILADDVKCGHGSTTGFLDPDAEFYLRARGMPALQAQAVLVCAFANDSLSRIRLTPLKERLACQLAERLMQDVGEGASASSWRAE